MKQKIITLLLLLFLPMLLPAQVNVDGKVIGELIISLHKSTNAKQFFGQLRLQKKQAFPLMNIKLLSHRNNIHLLKFDPTQYQEAKVLALLQDRKEINHIQPNVRLEFRQTPNDPDYNRQWGLEAIGMPDTWDLTTGGLTANGDTIVVAVLDEGFDIEHPDLRENVWTNHAEIPLDGIDNDNNGYIDDHKGWNFANDSAGLFQHFHGQSVAGIIGARGNNNLGITGVNWNVKLMLFVTHFLDQAIEAYEYVIDQRGRYNQSNGQEGAFIVATNASFGRDRKFCEEEPIWDQMYNAMGQVGVLTGAGTANASWDVEMEGDIPTTCSSDFIITVLNANQDGNVYTGSAFGAESIDMGAPGVGSYSTQLSNRYGDFGGNSAAAPHLTGAIAILYSLPCESLTSNALTQPSTTALVIREALLNGVEPSTGLNGKTVTGGMLNVYNSVLLLDESCSPGTVQQSIQINKVFPNPVNNQLFIEYQTGDFGAYSIQIFNMLGQIVQSDELKPAPFGPRIESFNLNNLAPGVYHILVDGEQDRITKKIVVH